MKIIWLLATSYWLLAFFITICVASGSGEMEVRMKVKINQYAGRLRNASQEFLAGAAGLAAGQGPSGQAVRRELRRILDTDPLFKSDWQFDWGQLNWEWVNSVADLLSKPLIILLVLAVGCGIYFLWCNLTPYLQGAMGEGRINVNAGSQSETPQPGDVNLFYQQALGHAAAAEYRAAVIALHKATVAYIFARVIVATTGKTYTNNDLRHKLAGDQILSRPFAVITTYAEIAGFSANQINSTDYHQALAVFEQYFLPNRRGCQ